MDNINPDHYKKGTSLECIEAMRIIFGDEAVADFCICNAFEYIWCWKNKNGEEDLHKADWYLKLYSECVIPKKCFEMSGRMSNYIFNKLAEIESGRSENNGKSE